MTLINSVQSTFSQTSGNKCCCYQFLTVSLMQDFVGSSSTRAKNGAHYWLWPTLWKVCQLIGSTSNGADGWGISFDECALYERDVPVTGGMPKLRKRLLRRRTGNAKKTRSRKQSNINQDEIYYRCLETKSLYQGKFHDIWKISPSWSKSWSTVLINWSGTSRPPPIFVCNS